jgi:hypothetical protein
MTGDPPGCLLRSLRSHLHEHQVRRPEIHCEPIGRPYKVHGPRFLGPWPLSIHAGADAAGVVENALAGLGREAEAFDLETAITDPLQLRPALRRWLETNDALESERRWGRAIGRSLSDPDEHRSKRPPA